MSPDLLRLSSHNNLCTVYSVIMTSLLSSLIKWIFTFDSVELGPDTQVLQFISVSFQTHHLLNCHSSPLITAPGTTRNSSKMQFRFSASWWKKQAWLFVYVIRVTVTHRDQQTAWLGKLTSAKWNKRERKVHFVKCTLFHTVSGI
jgi:hypothetical protein